MKAIITTFIVLYTTGIFAQTSNSSVDLAITDHMGAFISQFQVFSNSQNLNPTKQMIGKRIFSKEDNPMQAETWSFEFTSTAALQKRKETGHQGHYKISCFEDKKTLLFTVYISKEEMIVWNNDTYYTYAINMQDFPIVLMDNISIIDIAEIE